MPAATGSRRHVARIRAGAAGQLRGGGRSLPRAAASLPSRATSPRCSGSSACSCRWTGAGRSSRQRARRWRPILPSPPSTAWPLRAWAAAGKPDSMRAVAERWARLVPGDEAPYREWGAAALAATPARGGARGLPHRPRATGPARRPGGGAGAARHRRRRLAPRPHGVGYRGPAAARLPRSPRWRRWARLRASSGRTVLRHPRGRTGLRRSAAGVGAAGEVGRSARRPLGTRGRTGAVRRARRWKPCGLWSISCGCSGPAMRCWPGRAHWR